MNDRPTFDAFRNHLNRTPAASLAMIASAAAQDTNQAERLWTGFSSVVGMAFDKSGKALCGGIERWPQSLLRDVIAYFIILILVWPAGL